VWCCLHAVVHETPQLGGQDVLKKQHAPFVYAIYTKVHADMTECDNFVPSSVLTKEQLCRMLASAPQLARTVDSTVVRLGLLPLLDIPTTSCSDRAQRVRGARGS
jgi:hypothetical protein